MDASIRTAIALGMELAIARIPRPDTFDDRTTAERARSAELAAEFEDACRRAGRVGGWLARRVYINAHCDRLGRPRVYA